MESMAEGIAPDTFCGLLDTLAIDISLETLTENDRKLVHIKHSYPVK